MSTRTSSKVTFAIAGGASVLALAAFVVFRPPAVLDQMALPERTSASIVRDVAKKARQVVQDIAAFARTAPTRPFADYDIESVRRGVSDVPQVFHASLPNELIGISHVPHRKDRFLALVLPLVLKVNAEIAADRERLLAIAAVRAAGRPLSTENQAWLTRTAARYDADANDLAPLLRRVDIIPTSLALAQAAEESGWGTSRFAHQGNALFGQRAGGDESGMAPTEDDSVRVRAYESLADGVESYARNLNTHPAYADFRAARARHRDSGVPLAGAELARTLTKYSERGLAYVQSLRAIIRLNRLEAFDNARLAGQADERVARL